MSNSAIAYVDGFNLYNGIHEAFEHRFLWLDLVKLFESLRPLNELVKVKYFTSVILDDPDAQGRQSDYINALKTLYPSQIEVVLGRYQRKQMSCNACGATWISYEEKETDVNIAVQMVSDALATEAENFYVVSGDSDLVPAIKLVQEHAPELFTIAFFPPSRHSDALKKLMPASQVIGRQRLKDSQLPDMVTADGTEYSRPAKWTLGQFEDAEPIDLSTLPIPIPKPGAHLHTHG